MHLYQNGFVIVTDSNTTLKLYRIPEFIYKLDSRHSIWIRFNIDSVVFDESSLMKGWYK